MTIDSNKVVDHVSIIMAAYNAEETIELAICSVMMQTYPHWELIVVNDCSRDRTSAIVSSLSELDPRIRLIQNRQNSGVSISRKAGMENANGDWIAILDSDDIWETDKLEKELRLAHEQNAELVFTGSAFVDETTTLLNWMLHVPRTLTFRQLLKQNLVSNSSVLVRSELYKAYYAVNDNMHEDFAIWLGITRTGRKAYGIDEPLLIYRLAKSSKSSNKLKAAKMNWNTYRYIGLNYITAFFYMCWYTVNGLLKYRHLKQTQALLSTAK